MRSAAHSSLATLLLLVPILAIPLLAVFGVPQFVPNVESPLEDGADPDIDATDAPAFASISEETASPFTQEGVTAATPSTDDWGTAALAEDRLAQRRRELRAEPTASTATSPPPTRPAAAPYRRPTGTATQERDPATTPHGEDATLTWRSAVARLNELEIRNFRLEPGQHVGEFVFICSFTPADSPWLSQRFEAQADEPLRAVENVLDQIDDWMTER